MPHLNMTVFKDVFYFTLVYFCRNLGKCKELRATDEAREKFCMQARLRHFQAEELKGKLVQDNEFKNIETSSLNIDCF